MLEHIEEILNKAKEELEYLTYPKHKDAPQDSKFKYGYRVNSKLDNYKLRKQSLIIERENLKKELEGINIKIEVLRNLRSKKAYDEISYLEDRKERGNLILEEGLKELEDIDISIKDETTKIAELEEFIAELEDFKLRR